MKSEISLRAQEIAKYLLKNKATIREAAKVFNVSKSTAHLDLSKRLKKINYSLYEDVKIILEKNFNEKHLRGGQATKNKFKNAKIY